MWGYQTMGECFGLIVSNLNELDALQRPVPALTGTEALCTEWARAM